MAKMQIANTGRNARLWELLQNYLGRDILTAWCVCHRSDLALESVQNEVPELSIWMANVIAVSTFFRTSPRRTKLLHKVSLLYNIDDIFVASCEM